MSWPRKNTQGLEDNTLAILDTAGVRDARDVHDDRLAFLEAVRAASLASVSPSPPTWKMYDAILHILLYGRSLELTIASYQLLTELDKHYPRVYWKLPDVSVPSSSANGGLVVNKEAWSPFWFGTDKPYYCEATGDIRDTKDLYDSLMFSTLLEEIAMKAQSGIKIMEKMLLFQYLICVLEADFLPRHASYKEALDWIILRESMLCMLLASRKMNYRSVVRNCMSMISTRGCHQNNMNDMDNDAQSISTELPQSCNVGLSFVYTEILRETCDAAQKLLVLIMEFDVVRKEADSYGLISRSDGFRFPIVDTILDELTYNKDQISLFLQVFGEPKWKLEIILMYFGKYHTRPSTRTRMSNCLPNDETFEGILNCFSTVTTCRGILRKVSSDMAILLLSHAFQAFLCLKHDQKYGVIIEEKIGGGSLLQICSSLVSAFENIRKVDDRLELTSFEKQAFFTATAMVSQGL